MFSFSNRKSKKGKLEIKTLEQAIAQINHLENKLEEASGKIKDMENKSNSFFQKFSMVRFNPFNEIGGDQSFSIAMLDNNDTGFVLTSIFIKESARIFAKPVKKGISQYQLSEDEKQAIEKAKKQ
ncbi:MAG: DUF4446 family protein [Candidatus Paceibacterota bacterium]|jgi:hypothetical protein